MSPEQHSSPHEQKVVTFDTLLSDPSIKISPERNNAHAIRVQFDFDNEVLATLRLLFNDPTGSDVVITNMTVLPKQGNEDMTGGGYGTKALERVLSWAREQGMKEVRATQVSSSIGFWEKNGFVRAPDPNPTGDYLFTL